MPPSFFRIRRFSEPSLRLKGRWDMQLYWWLFWLVPITLTVLAVFLRRRPSRRYRSKFLARGTMSLSVISPLIGARGILNLQTLQTRESGDLLFEGVGLWTAVLSSVSCIVWLVADRNWRNTPAWSCLGASVWALSVWNLMLMAIQ